MAMHFVSGKTLVLGDLHLRPIRSVEDLEVFEWARDAVRKVRPRWLVLNGDTFELSLVRDSLRTHESELRRIVEVHKSDLIDLLSSVPEGVVFVFGDHDFRLEFLAGIVTEVLLPSRLEVVFAEAVFHVDSATAVFHGHQLDFNLTEFLVDGVAFTERVSALFESFVLDGSARERAFAEACLVRRYSFWYCAGFLPEYLEALRSIFGYEPDRYKESFVDLLRSSFFKRWLSQNRNCINRVVGRGLRWQASGLWLGRAGARALARFPLWLFLNRARAILYSGRLPTSLFPRLGRTPAIRNVVIAHSHFLVDERCGWPSRRIGRLCAVATPRAHVKGMEGRAVKLEFDSAFAELGDSVSYVGQTRTLLVPA